MTAICLIDTSVFLEILNVPTKATRHQQITDELRDRIQHREKLFLPMATILETGNHIGQNGDGNQRRICAQRFVHQVRMALAGESPFQPIDFLQARQLDSWLDEFPDQAGRGIGLGDLTIIHDWKRVCDQNPGLRVYIWSLDQHLSSYDREADLFWDLWPARPR